MWLYDANGDAYWVDGFYDDEVRNAPPTRPVMNSRRTSVAASRTPAMHRTMVPMRVAPPVAPATPVFVAQRETGGATINLRNLSVGTIAQLAAKVLAAITPLPDPPAPAATASPTDVALDHLEYTRRVAEHAKSNERVRTLGDIASALIA